MGGNRRNQSGAVRFVPALKAVLLCTLIGGSCVGYALQKKRIYELGQQIGARQTNLEKLKKESQVLADRLAAMQLPQRLAEKARELKLGLVPPLRGQILWISDSLPPAPTTNIVPLHYVQSHP